MPVRAAFKLLLAFGAAVLLPLGRTDETDHNSRARRSRWEWAGLGLTQWQVEENSEFLWVRDVLKLPPDYFVQASGSFIFGYSIGALPGKFLETKLFMELWEKATADERPLVCVEAVLCLVERDWKTREQMVEEAKKRWRRDA